MNESQYYYTYYAKIAKVYVPQTLYKLGPFIPYLYRMIL